MLGHVLISLLHARAAFKMTRDGLTPEKHGEVRVTIKRQIEDY